MSLSIRTSGAASRRLLDTKKASQNVKYKESQEDEIISFTIIFRISEK
jgi:hypothetical protein